jgi:hypothetical protein
MEQSQAFYGIMTEDKEKERMTGSGVVFGEAYFGFLGQETETDSSLTKVKRTSVDNKKTWTEKRRVFL